MLSWEVPTAFLTTVGRTRMDEQQQSWYMSGLDAHLRSLFDAMTRSQSRTLCFFRNFFVRYLRYLGRM